MKLPWTFLLFAAGIVLLAGDGYFPGEDFVGILAILTGILRSVVQLIASLAVAQINRAVREGRIKQDGTNWLPPKAPPRTKK